MTGVILSLHMAGSIVKIFSNQVMLEKRNISEEFNSSVFEIAVRIFQIIFYKITDCEH